MLHDDFIRVEKSGTVVPQDSFISCMRLNDWTPVPVPRLALKRVIQGSSQFVYSIQSKGKN